MVRKQTCKVRMAPRKPQKIKMTRLMTPAASKTLVHLLKQMGKKAIKTRKRRRQTINRTRPDGQT